MKHLANAAIVCAAIAAVAFVYTKKLSIDFQAKIVEKSQPVVVTGNADWVESTFPKNETGNGSMPGGYV